MTSSDYAAARLDMLLRDGAGLLSAEETSDLRVLLDERDADIRAAARWFHAGLRDTIAANKAMRARFAGRVRTLDRLNRLAAARQPTDETSGS